jgi:YegS/Rv2252/BmrU family lipid kinase
MPTPRTVLIVNPESKRGLLGRRWPDLAATIRRAYGPFEEARTRSAGDATELAREALRSGARRVIAMGGDGTINEVAGGFFADGEPVAPEAALGVLPFGTGGDFRKTIGMPKELEPACEILARGNTRTLDAGVISFLDPARGRAERIFINIASFGISGVVDELVNQGSKRLGGRLSFLIATARASLRYKNQRVRLVFDDDEEDPVDMLIHTVAVANGQYFGGGMKIAPDADPGDGQFDVVALGDMSTRDMMLSGHRVYAGSHLGLDKVSCRRARKVRAEPLDPDPVRLDVDGETPGILPATFEILPASLNVIVP